MDLIASELNAGFVLAFFSSQNFGLLLAIPAI